MSNLIQNTGAQAGFGPAPAPAAAPQQGGNFQQVSNPGQPDPGQPGPGPQGPQMEFNIEDSTGKGSTVDDQYILQQLAQGGYNPIEVSPDGTMITLADAQGEYQVTMQSALEGLGFQVTGIKPVNAAYGKESGQLRAAITKLPDDNAKKSFLEQSLQNQGMAGAQVAGSGRDWFVYSPEQGQWISITNNPDWDSTDAVEGMMEVPRAVGSIVGGALGAGSGLLTGGTTSVPGFIGGTAAGGFAGDAIGRGALSMWNPEYASVAEENIGGILKDMTIGSAVDAGSAGILRGAGPAIGKMISPNLGRAVTNVTDGGVISPAVRGAGQFAEGVGEGVGRAATAVNTPVGRSAGAVLVPGLGELEMVGAGLQAPGMIARNIPNMMSKAGRSETMQKYAPKAGNWLDNQSHRFRTVRAQPTEAQRAQQAYGIPRARDSYAPYETTSESVAGSLAAGGSEAQKRAAQAAGRGVDQAEFVGSKLQDISQGIMDVGLRSTAAAGRGMEAAGAAARKTGSYMGPVESRLGLRYSPAGTGAEEYLNESSTDLGDYFKNELEALRRKRMKRNIEPQNSMGY